MSSDTPGPESEPRQPNFGPHNVLAVLPDLEAARAAIADLEHAGIEANSISLLGRAAEDAAAPDLEQQEQMDQAVVGDTARTAGKSAAAGAGIGGLAGFVAGAAAFGIPGIGPAVGAGIWATVLGGATAGAGVGFTAGGVASVKESEAWHLTFGSVREGKAVVGVHGEDADMVNEAGEILRRHDPERVEEFDVAGARRV